MKPLSEKFPETPPERSSGTSKFAIWSIATDSLKVSVRKYRFARKNNNKYRLTLNSDEDPFV